MVKTRLKIISISIMLVASLSIMNGDTFAVEEMDMKQSCTGNEEKLDASRCILYKAIMEEVKHCYVDKNGSDYGTKGTVSLKDVNNKTEKSLLLSVFNKVGTYHLPTAFANTSIGSKDNKTMNCYEIANGSWMYSGIKSFKNSMVYNQKELVSLNLTDNEDKNRDDVFASLGYKKDASKSTESEYDKIIKLEYKTYTTNTENGVETSNETTYSNDVYGIKLKSNSKIESIEKIKTDQTNGELVNVKPARSYWGQKSFTIEKCSIHNNSLPSCPVSDRVLAFDYGKDENDDTYQKFLDALNSKKGKVVYTSRTENQAKDANNNPVPGSSIDVYNSTTTLHNVTETSENDNIDVTFSIKGDRTKAAHRAIYTISGEYNKLKNNLDGLKFSKVQVVGLLENYISEYYAVGDPVVPETQEEVNNYKSSGSYIATKWMTEEGTYNCAFISKEPADHENVNVYVVSNETNLFVGTGNGFSYDKLPGRLEYRLGKNTCDNFDPETNLNTDEDARMDSDPSTLVEDQEGVDSGKNEKNTDACSQVSGLAWLLCPIIELASNAVVSIYNNIVEPLLKVEPTMFKREGSGTFEAWNIFRNISNILLIIFFLVIIFSQLTGIGIDNYGIKKTLPRLITAALLINLSYIISQASVDLSNILGKSFNATFDSLADLANVKGAIPPSDSSIGGAIAADATISVAVIGGTVAGITATGGWAAVAGAALAALPTVVAALIAALIAVIFFFVLLGARQAGVVILVVISPLAFACYMLPNTKKFFDRWKKAFTALLLLYPIAGALMGGGGFTSAVLLNVNKSSDQNFWFQIVALLVQVIPFFFIPSLLKSSFAALGNIGNKISGFGQRLGRSWGGAAKRGISNASTYKNARLATANARAAARQERLQSSLDKKVAAGGYKDKDGNTITTYEGLSPDQKKAFAAANKDFRTQDKLMKMAADKKTQDEYTRGIAAGAFSTTDQTAATEEKSWGDAAISANTNALNNETYFETDEKEFTDDDGNSLGTYKYDYETNQWKKKLDDGSLGEALDTDRIVTDKDGQKWKTDKEGKLRKVKEDGSLGEAYKRKTFKGSDGRDYHFQDGKMVGEDGKELADGVTITDENGMKFQKAGVDAEGYAQYKPVDFKPDATLDKDATYKYNGHDCHFDGDKLFYEDDEGKKVEVGEGAEVLAMSGKNAGYSYKMGKNGLEFAKSKDIEMKDGRKVAFYAGKNGKFELHDVDQYNANSGRMKELEGKLELAREKLDHLPDGQARMEAGREVAALGTELDNLRASTELKDGTELGIGDVSFKYNKTSGRLAALNGTLKDDTAGFTYNGQALRLGSNGIFKTESGLEMRSINPGVPAIFRDDGSGVFRDIETGTKASPEQVAKAQAENKIKSHNDLRVMQARGSDAMQVGNLVGMLGANMDNYTRNAVLGAQNKTINQINNTIGEGDAIRKAHTNGIETTTTSLATTENINKQFEATTGGNIAARERADTFKINQFDDNDIYNKATGTNALADLTAIANSTTERAGKRQLAQTMINSGVYNGGRAYDTADKARKFINTFKNAYDLGGERGEFTQEEIASIERLTPQQRHEVEDVLAGRSNAYDFLQNENVTDGQKLYLRQIWGGDTSVVNRNNPVSIFSSDPSVQAYREAMMSAASAGRKVSAEAVIGKTTTQSNQAVDAAAIKNKNQFNQELATNAVGEVELNMDVLTRQAENEYNLKAAKNNIDITPVISASYAQNLEKQRFDIAQEKMYDEGFKLLPKGDLMNLLNGLSTSPFSSDSNYLRSLLKNAQIKCGDDDVAKFVKANQGTMNAAQRVVFDEFFAASRDPLFKAYSKIVGACKEAGVATINLPTFEQWCTGTAIIPAAAAASKPNYVSMAAYVSSQDEKALAEAEKSSIKIAFSDPNYTRNYSDRQLVYGLIHNKNQEAGIALREGINGFGSTKRAALIDQIQNGEISSITENAMSTLIGQNISGITTKNQITDPSILSAVDRLALSYNNLSPQMKDRIPNYLVRLFKLFYP